MKLLNKPSHYLALLLTLTGGLLVLQGEKVLPKEGPKKARWLTHQERLDKLRSLAKTHESGKNDMLAIKNGTSLSSQVQDEGATPTLAQLVTLQGSVSPEMRYPDSKIKVTPRTEPYPVNIELIWMDQGTTAGLGVMSSNTDDKGNFGFKDLKPGAYRLRAIPEDKDSLHLPIAIDLQIPELEELSPGEQPRFPISELVLPLPRSMQGVCAWAEALTDGSSESTEGNKSVESTQNPLALDGLTISVSEVGMFRGSAVADAKGNFRIEGVGEGPYTVRIRSPQGNDVPVVTATDQPQTKGEVPMMVLARQNP